MVYLLYEIVCLGTSMPSLLGSTGTESPAGNGGSKGATTFVQADSTCFRDLVQRLTGPPVNETAQPVAAVKAPKKPTAELHERRKLNARYIEIARPATSFKVYQLLPAVYNPQFQSPSPSSMLQVSPIRSCNHPVAPYSHPSGSNKRVSEADGDQSLEEKATKEKRSNLHRSPRSKPRLDIEDNGASTVSAQPKLLTLFPLTSPTTAAIVKIMNLD
ncbi:VQ motif-containing protein 31-like [Primulina huaijiensis]|uniref:VQ motif-containing protein 31-like n=1 Tax=Primulina huaijiensis TaxID=1492673 RepID=UPI003CC6ECB8